MNESYCRGLTLWQPYLRTSAFCLTAAKVCVSMHKMNWSLQKIDQNCFIFVFFLTVNLYVIFSAFFCVVCRHLISLWLYITSEKKIKEISEKMRHKSKTFESQQFKTNLPYSYWTAVMHQKQIWPDLLTFVSLFPHSPVHVCQSTKSPFILQKPSSFRFFFFFLTRNLLGVHWKNWTFTADFWQTVCTLCHRMLA